MSRRDRLRPPARGRLLAAPLLLFCLAASCLAAPGAAVAADAAGLSAEAGYGLLRRFLSPSAGERRAAAREMIEARDASLVPGLVDTYFFLPRNQRAEALSALTALTGEKRGDRYHDWVELVGRREDLAPKAGYLDYKAELFSRIDPRYRTVLYEGAPARIRLEEIVFGGVPLEGIPALERPAHVPAADAKYLSDSERVFGVSVGGEQRAYPLRILDWHEMLNDVVGGEPVTLSYCTLCGSGVLYSTRTPAGQPYTFGTSGLLYRSNKLMIDRQTLSLWNNLTGEPVVGRLARSPVRLPVLPLTITTWKEWRTRHPGSTVLALDRDMERRWGFSYLPGAADRRRAGVAFPVWLKSKALDPKAEVYAVRLGDQAKAYPLERALKERVINDRLGDEPLVVVADAESGAVRVYRRGGRTFSAGDKPGELVDGEGRRWSAGEDSLTPQAADPEAPPLARLPGHQAFWFGWYSFFPRSELYGAEPR
ncbi:MAG TPA: DUF3179 domain-containing protein [Thermoanaerobaculia bacterium]|nr:DUF3179 domain-containing protein [Thermoanaerobaculia bacterium]